MHVSIPETSAHDPHDPHDVDTELGVEDADDVWIDDTVQHERP